MLTLYGFPRSRSLRAAWALEECGATYHYVKIELGSSAARTPEFRAINPAGKVPALVDGDLVITESTAIVNYLGARYPDSALLPADLPTRAHYDQWVSFAVSELEQGLWTIAKHSFALPEDWRQPAIKDTARKEFTVAAGLLEQGLGDQPYILGEQFTGADIFLAHTLRWAQAAKFSFAEQPRLEAYLQRCFARPAVQRAIDRENA